MAEILLTPPVTTDTVTFEAYLEHYAEARWEWVDGKLVAPMPIEERHFIVSAYLLMLFQAYFSLNPIGVVRGEPFVMRLGTRACKSDLMLIFNGNPHLRQKTYLDGPADLVVEILSAGTERVDMADKFLEYEAGGVREYWLIDHRRQSASFYLRGDDGLYHRQEPDAVGEYRTVLLPRFALHVPTLWQETLPDYFAIGDQVRQRWSADA